jgi:hypothetical protein
VIAPCSFISLHHFELRCLAGMDLLLYLMVIILHIEKNCIEAYLEVIDI